MVRLVYIGRMSQPDVLPRLERPTREHALRFARILFERGERVDMQTLASALGVGRTTLYRWVGDREQLIGDVLAGLASTTFDMVTERATGRGLDRALDVIGRFMEQTSSWEPLRSFAQREPGPALRILLAEEGAVADCLRAGFGRALRENLDQPVDDEVVDIVVQLATAMEWAPIVIGEPPAIERAVALTRTLLETTTRANGHAPRRRARRSAGAQR